MKITAAKLKAKSRYTLGYLFVNLRRLLIESFRKRNGSPSSVFIDEGFMEISHERFKGLSEYLTPKITSYINTGELAENLYLKTLMKNEIGIKTIAVDVGSSFLYERIFNKEFYDLIYEYYRKPFYLRNNPTIEICYSEDPQNETRLFHVDWGLKQVSLMINLLDLSEASTHMVYLAGSNKHYWFGHPPRDSKTFKKQVADYLRKTPNSIRSTIGERDSAFLFDAGNGFHRQVARGPRLMLHMNFVENLVFSYWDKKWIPEDVPGEHYWFSGYNENIERMIESSHIPKSFFSLVFKKSASRLGVPVIYNSRL